MCDKNALMRGFKLSSVLYGTRRFLKNEEKEADSKRETNIENQTQQVKDFLADKFHIVFINCLLDISLQKCSVLETNIIPLCILLRLMKKKRRNKNFYQKKMLRHTKIDLLKKNDWRFESYFLLSLSKYVLNCVIMLSEISFRYLVFTNRQLFDCDLNLHDFAKKTNTN